LVTVAKTIKKHKWGVERRLEFIELQLFWEGSLNRADLINEFGLSVPQASKDLSLYQEQAPKNLSYDKSLKKYFASKSFKPQFCELDGDKYLQSIVSDDVAKTFSIDALPIPHRTISVDVLRSLLMAIRSKQAIEILYQSMSNGRTEPTWRKISPHSIGTDGLRWHARAYCHIDNKYKDFIISRCGETRSVADADLQVPADRLWNEVIDVQLIPNPLLNYSQKAVIASDFGMELGQTSVQIRKAMLYYFWKRLRLDIAEKVDSPSEAPVVIKNRAEFETALSEAMR
jgi:hypothetical protein